MKLLCLEEFSEPREIKMINLDKVEHYEAIDTHIIFSTNSDIYDWDLYDERLFLDNQIDLNWEFPETVMSEIAYFLLDDEHIMMRITADPDAYIRWKFKKI